jgi:Arc/MetJ-type ribon-helix-helix transcriptional regulator
MPGETEKITLNLTPVDLGKIDLLVDQGMYSTRSDFLRNAVRRALDDHAAVINETAARDAYSWGVMHYTRASLERRRKAGERFRLRVIGHVRIDDDVPPELFESVFDELVVMGVLKVPAAIADHMGDRIRRGTSLRSEDNERAAPKEPS